MERFQSLGRFMKSMMNRKASPELRDGRFSEIGPRIGAVGLAGDSVVPGYAVAETLGKFCQPGRIAVLDFPFPYSHEQPFPLQLPREGGGGSAEAGIGGPVRGEVDVWCGRMAGAAAEVLCGA